MKGDIRIPKYYQPPHPFFEHYKKTFTGMESIIGIKHHFDENKRFWFIGMVRQVTEHELLLEHLDGRFLTIDLDVIEFINWYYESYFIRRGLRDPKKEWEAVNGKRVYD